MFFHRSSSETQVHLAAAQQDTHFPLGPVRLTGVGMPSAGKAPQILRRGLSAATRPQYVCRTCRDLLKRENQQIRHNSSLSSRQTIRQAPDHSSELRRYVSFGSFIGRAQPSEEPAHIEDEAVPKES